MDQVHVLHKQNLLQAADFLCCLRLQIPIGIYCSLLQSLGLVLEFLSYVMLLEVRTNQSSLHIGYIERSHGENYVELWSQELGGPGEGEESIFKKLFF